MLMGDFLSLRSAASVKSWCSQQLARFIEIEQKSTAFSTSGTDFKNPNFAAMAEACGVRGIGSRIRPSRRGIAAALAHNGPVLVDAVVSRTVLPIRPIMWKCQGIHLYMVKAVFNVARRICRSRRSNLWA